MQASAGVEQTDFVSLAGRTIALTSIWEAGGYGPRRRRALREAFLNATPFPHLVIEDLFNPALLELIHEEFNAIGSGAWRHSKSDNESTHRSRRDAIVTPAADIYFAKIYSREFLRFLSDVTGVEALIPDAELIGGGMHESRTGDWFNIHVDFARHPKTLLTNEFVLLTYLNKGWRDDYGGSLELWETYPRRCVKTITPTFGRTVILKQGKTSLHGHTKPICAPDGRPRRSVAAYYYSQREKVAVPDVAELGSVFMLPKKTALSQFKQAVRLVSPPIMVDGFKRLRRAMHLTKDWDSPTSRH